ncbi:MAG: GNAT family N-acetyltransferase, partial [Candidatus Bathyarchaeia archaeon]
MKGPRTLKREEFDELINMLCQIFRLDEQGYNLSFWRGLYDHDLEDILVIEEDGRIVSHVSIFPLQVSVRGTNIKVGEIGGVATDEKYRMRGF